MRGHWVLCLLTLVAVVVGVHALERGELEQLPHGAKLLASFLRVEYDWDGAPAGAEEMFRFDNCAITGVKWYNDELYLTVPRWRPGVPSTLNKLGRLAAVWSAAVMVSDLMGAPCRSVQERRAATSSVPFVGLANNRQLLCAPVCSKHGECR